MIKHFCNICDVQLTKTNTITVNPIKYGAIEVNVTVIGDDSDYCKYCIIDAIKSIDDRPKMRY